MFSCKRYTSHVSLKRRVVEVGNVSPQAARAAVIAATATLKQRTLGYVPHAGTDANRRQGAVHGSVELLLNILQHRLADTDVNSVNPTVARFKFDNDKQPLDGNIPVLTSVRFEGKHILDSAQACRLIVEEGRPLAVLSFRLDLSYSDSTSESGISRHDTFPVTISLETDHVRIVTGLGIDPLESWRAHAEVKTAIWAEMTDGHQADSLDDLFDRMRERAQSSRPSSEPSFLLTRTTRQHN